MFDIDALVVSCVDCLAEGDPRRAVREVLTRTFERHTDVADTLRPETAGITMIYRSPELTVIDVVWAPGMSINPHDHRMWAAIAVYSGREDNEFFVRNGHTLCGSHGRTVAAGDVLALGASAIHGVHNPGVTPTGAIHVYGGDFVDMARSQWLPPEYVEEPYDAAHVARVFAEANTTWHG